MKIQEAIESRLRFRRKVWRRDLSVSPVMPNDNFFWEFIMPPVGGRLNRKFRIDFTPDDILADDWETST